MNIQVTSPRYDNIGKVLKSMDLPFEQYRAKDKIDCDILFMNCGTSDIIEKEVLRNFVQSGGIFYASDLTSSFLDETFPNIFEFVGRGNACTLDAEIVDARLIEYIGKNISVKFDLGSWSMLDNIKSGTVIMKRIDTGKPLMVEVPYSKGRIYYTSFHNHAQASEKEIALLKILVLTQLSVKNKKSIKEMADIINFDISDIQKKWGGNEKKTNSNSNSNKAKVEFDFEFDKKQVNIDKSKKFDINEFNF